MEEVGTPLNTACQAMWLSKMDSRVVPAIRESIQVATLSNEHTLLLSEKYRVLGRPSLNVYQLRLGDHE